MLFRTPAHAATAFVLGTLAIVTTALVLSARLASLDNPEALAVGIALDLVVLVPTLFYVLVARPRGWSATAVLPVVLLGAVLAGAVLPDAFAKVLRPVYIAIPLVEGALAVVILARIGRIVRTYRAQPPGDVLARLRAALRSILPRGAAEAVAYEATLFRYALGPTVPAPASSDTSTPFSSHRTSSYRFLLIAGLIGGSVELIGVHFLLLHLAPGWAWLHLLVSAYALVWLIGDYRALRQRPTTLTPDAVRVNAGLRWSAEVPLTQIAEVRRITKASALADAEGYLSLGGVDTPQLLLVLRAPVEVVGPYGIRKDASLLGVRIDEPEAFAQAVQIRNAGA
ncbi:MAG: hypothetical protein AAF809_01020 [Bacteroidota bacterium]